MVHRIIILYYITIHIRYCKKYYTFCTLANLHVRIRLYFHASFSHNSSSLSKKINKFASYILRISQFHPLDFIRNEQGRFQTVIQLCPSFSYLFSSFSFRFLPLLRSSLSRDSGVVRSEEQGNDKAEKASRRATSLRLS